MKSTFIRDKKRRDLVKKYDGLRSVLHYLLRFYSKENKNSLTIKLLSELNSLPKNSSRSRLRNRCVISYKSRSVTRKFKLSRIQLRESCSFGLLPGFNKAVW